MGWITRRCVFKGVLIELVSGWGFWVGELAVA